MPKTKSSDSQLDYPTIESLYKKKKDLLAEIEQLHTQLPGSENVKRRKRKSTALKKQIKKIDTMINKALPDRRSNEELEIEKSKAEEKPKPQVVTGMTDLHTHIMAKFSKENNVITMWRPINKVAASKLNSNNGAPSKLSTHSVIYRGKKLNTKAKSSEFGPIAGDIPVDARLSKVSMTDPDHVDRFQEKNIKALKDSNVIYKKFYKDISPKNRDLIDEANSKSLLTKTVKRDEQGRELFFITDTSGNIIWDKDQDSNKVPKLAAIENGKLFLYDYNQQQFSKENSTQQDDWQLEQVEIFAYKKFIIFNNEVTAIDCPITADYDELVSAGCKFFPFDNNKEIHAKISQRLFEAMITKDYETQKIEVANLIFDYENKLREEHRDRILLDEMGFVNAWQWSMKAYLKDETAEATNHGPEVNNPFPEAFSNSDHPIYLPNGDIVIKNSEMEICELINEWRAKGYPLDVNPKWGWEIDKNGEKLSVPKQENKFEWERVHDDLQAMQAAITGLELNRNQKLIDLGLKPTTNNIKILRDLKKKFAHKLNIDIVYDEKVSLVTKLEWGEGIINKKISSEAILEVLAYDQELNEQQKKFDADKLIIDMRVAINRLRLEPRLIYAGIPETIDPNHPNPIAEFVNEIAKKVSDLELQSRLNRINELEKKLDALNDNYQVTYYKPSILAVAEEEFDTGQAMLKQNHSKPKPNVTSDIFYTEDTTLTFFTSKDAQKTDTNDNIPTEEQLNKLEPGTSGGK